MKREKIQIALYFSFKSETRALLQHSFCKWESNNLIRISSKLFVCTFKAAAFACVVCFMFNEHYLPAVRRFIVVYSPMPMHFFRVCAIQSSNLSFLQFYSCSAHVICAIYRRTTESGKKKPERRPSVFIYTCLAVRNKYALMYNLHRILWKSETIKCRFHIINYFVVSF